MVPRAAKWDRIASTIRRLISSDAPSPGAHQTKVVESLWASRVADGAQPSAAARGSVAASEVKVAYPFATDADLRDSYVNAFGTIRLGRILEDLDALAGSVAFRHCAPAPEGTAAHDGASQAGGEHAYHIVTASIDRILMTESVGVEDDMELTGCCYWVGRSSMEIGMLAKSVGAAAPWLEARFTFVALRDGRAAQIPALDPTTAAERERFAAGAARAEAKKAARKAAAGAARGSAAGAACATDEHPAAARVRSFLAEARVLDALPALGAPGSVRLADTRLSNVLVAQPQQRNTAGRVFGGFLCRRAFELAFSAAFVFAGAAPRRCAEVDEVSFRKAVEVGNLLRFEAAVLYTAPIAGSGALAGTDTQAGVGVEAEAGDGAEVGVEVHVEVECHVVDVAQRTTQLVNLFAFTFVVPTAQAAPLRRVLPGNAEEAQKILDRMRANEAQEMLR